MLFAAMWGFVVVVVVVVVVEKSPCSVSVYEMYEFMTFNIEDENSHVPSE